MSAADISKRNVKYEEIPVESSIKEEFLCLKGRPFRLLAMVLICSTSFVAVIGFESLSAYQEPIIESLNITTSEYSFMLSVSAWACIATGTFEGILIDKIFGVNVGGFIYLGIYTLGLSLIAVAILYTAFWCALLGALLAGIGSLGFFSCLNILCIKFFKGKELSLVMSLMTSVTRFGYSAIFAMAFPLLNYVKETYSVSVNGSTASAMFIGLTFFLAAAIFIGILKCMNPYERIKRESWSSRLNFITCASMVRQLPPAYWLLQLCNCCVQVITLLMFIFAQMFFVAHFNMEAEAANSIISNCAIFAGIVMPFVGIAVDRWGRDLILLFLAFFACTVAHLIMAYAPWTPYIGMCLLSLSLGVFASTISPLVGYVVPEERLGVAFGMGSSMIGVVYSLHIYVFGVLIENYGFEAMELFVAAHAIAGCIFIIMIARIFYKSTGKWNMTAQDRKKGYEKGKEGLISKPSQAS